MTAGIPAEQAEVAALLRRLAGSEPVQTHISAVFRGPDTVWKLKKAVRLGFLDFTALADRERFLRRELALNAPHAPGLYRDVVPVIRTPSGLAVGGAGDPVDWVLRMAPVPETDFLDAMPADRFDPAFLAALADAVAAMHADQVPVPDTNPAARMAEVVRGNAAAARAAGIAANQVDAWEAEIGAALAQVAPLLGTRAGLVRRAHGDLHLGNLVLWHGRPTPFDALEFDEDLATIDPGYDLAFLLMDLEHLVSRPAANAVLNRYVARTGDAGLVGALAPFLSLRAMIRAHVAAARAQPCAALVAAAGAALQPGTAVVVAIGGLMGSGKSTLARAIAPGLGPAPGALVVRADEVRKRLFGLLPESGLGPHGYTPEAHARTESAMLDAIGQAARGGHAVIADATFLASASRARVAAVAASCRVGFAGFWLAAPVAELERRVAARTGDASDADLGVLRAALAWARPPDDWCRVDARDAGAAREQVQSRLAML